ncbi:MAG: ATP-binding protein [Deltaproteobacteria bacterium]|jgi:hypothetical protein|nr:ATP-binding protein [Deltaproteobacteria bacterium]
MTGPGGVSTCELPPECLLQADLKGAFIIGDVLKAADFDVPGIHGDAKAGFARRLAALAGPGGARPGPAVPIIGAAGAGKTHLLSDFCRRTLGGGGLFVAADLTDLARFWDSCSRAMTLSLMSEGPDGHTAAMRQARTLMASAGFDSLPTTLEAFSDWLGPLDATRLRIVLRNLVPKLRPATSGLAPSWEDAARCIVGLNSADPEIFVTAQLWLSGEDPGADSEELGLSGPCQGGPEAAFFAANSLMSLGGGFTVLAFDQLDSVLRDYTNDPGGAGPGGAGGRSRAAKEIARRLARIREVSRRTLVIVTCLGDVWSELAEAARAVDTGLFAPATILGPLTDMEFMEAVIAARMRPVFACAPAFRPPYPAYPFPRAFFESAEGLYPRGILRLAHEHVELCLKEMRVREWEPVPSQNDGGRIGPDKPTGSTSVQPPVPFRHIQNRFESSLASFAGAAPPPKDADVLWLGALEAFAECFVAERRGGLPIGCTLTLAPPALPQRSAPLIHCAMEMKLSKRSSRTLHLCIIPATNALSFQSRLKLALKISGLELRPLPGVRVTALRREPVPSGPTTRTVYDLFLKKGAVMAWPPEGLFPLMLALKEVAESHPDKWEEWAAKTVPVSGSGYLAAELKWLLEG